MTKPTNQKPINAPTERTPNTSAMASTASDTKVGFHMARPSVFTVEWPHAESGATPIKNSRAAKSGPVMRSYQGGPKVTFCPVNSSETIGKINPHRHTSRISMNSRLFSRKSASRESNELSCPAEVRSFQRCSSSARDAMNVMPMKPKNSGPMALCAKACTEDSTPERVRKVPKMTSA